MVGCIEEVENVMADAPIDVAVVVVGRNASAFVKGCFGSLARAEWRDYTYETIYVDNASEDDTLAMLGREFPDVRVIANDTNVGFCPAANQGAALSNARHFFFLNDDTLVLGDAVPRLVDFLDRCPEAGTVGSRLLYPDLTEQWSGRRFPSPINAIFGRRSVLSRLLPNARPLVAYLYKDKLEGGLPFEVDWISAAAQMVRADTFRRVGGFATDYYYWHEAILCDRIRKIGRSVYLHPESKIIHYEGQGTGARPYHLRKWHIINFHLGAYRCYCEHYDLGRLNPLRWFAAGALASRALSLLLVNKLTALRPASGR
jgi:N-acetylglucosaminyl-diphospho-decaprenol L-rhamnosyltransferase